MEIINPLDNVLDLGICMSSNNYYTSYLLLNYDSQNPILMNPSYHEYFRCLAKLRRWSSSDGVMMACRANKRQWRMEMDIQVISLFGDVYDVFGYNVITIIRRSMSQSSVIYNIVELHLKSMFLLSLFVQIFLPTDYIYK